MTCPACGRPMSAHSNRSNRLRHYCSRRCTLLANPPHDWNRDLDEVAVQRLLAGDHIESTKAERLEAVRALTARGRSASWIAAHLRIAERSVTRLRAELHTRREIAA